MSTLYSLQSRRCARPVISELMALTFFSAVKGGADRIEVCANLGVEGGTTPTLGLLKSIQNVVDVPIMVRPFLSLHSRNHS